MKKIFALVVVSLLTLVGCGKKSTLDYTELKERGYIVMGLDDTFAPMGFKDETGELQGFDIDLAKEVANIIDVEIRFQAIDWEMKEEELRQGNIDMIWNGYSITESRKEKVLFSDSYLTNKQIIVVLSDSTIETKKDLAGKSVAVQKQSSALEALKSDEELYAKLSGGNAIEFDTNNEALQDLEIGRVDAVVADEVLARYYINLKGEDKFRVLNDDFGSEEYAIGLRKDAYELKEAIDNALSTLKSNGKYDEIYDKWF